MNDGNCQECSFFRDRSHVCENCRYWLPYSQLCARWDFFTEYGIDTMPMGPSDYCSKWEGRDEQDRSRVR